MLPIWAHTKFAGQQGKGIWWSSVSWEKGTRLSYAKAFPVLQAPARKGRAGMLSHIQGPRLLTLDDPQQSLQRHRSLDQ